MIIEKIIRKIEQSFCKIYLSLKGIFSDNVINSPFEVIYVPTKLINKKADKSGVQRRRHILFTKVRVAGLVIEGIISGENLSEDSKFIACNQHFTENKKWEDTLYYENYLKNNKTKRKYKNWQDFKKRELKKWETIYRSIKEHGYKSQKQQGGFVKNGPEKEVEVMVSKKGEILFVDGRHRIITSKILGIKKIPVIVNVWDKKYIDWIKKEYNLKNPTPKEAIKPILNKRLDT